MSFDFREWYEKMSEGDVIISYQGEITSDLITNVLEVVESKLDDTPERSKIRKKVYNVLVECLQNLYHHSLGNVLENNINGKFGAFILSRIEFGYNIITGNFVKNERVQFLTDRINQINSLSKEELKSLYKMILNNQEFSEKGGGGLGMIDIARKTDSKLNYEFYKINDMFSFYTININIE
ncbi:MAG: SiaB family protein kinase [Marinilabiliales bacterium]